uniref:Uncharacterized protein n=1 Tax=Heterorhabditis bacteriophora TaxID=37862 RepID=A0A1I7X7F9_HETBA
MESNEESQESTSLDAKTTLRINGKQPVVEAQKSGKRGRPSRMCTSISASIPQNINVEKEVKLKEPNITVITTEELSSGDTQKDKDVKHQEFMDTSLISGPSSKN